MVGNLKNIKAVEIDGVSAEVLRISPPVYIFNLIESRNLSLSRGWFPECLKDANVYLLHKSGDFMKITNKYRGISMSPAISKVFEKIMYERLKSIFDKTKYVLFEAVWFSVVNEFLSTILLELQNKLGKEVLIKLSVSCLICVKHLIPLYMKFYQPN